MVFNVAKLKSKTPLVAALMCLLIGNFFLIQFYSDCLFDDAYTHMSIARELVIHGAPDFNSGERVFVSSAQGWVWLMALIFKLFGTSLLGLTWLFSAGLTLLITATYSMTRKLYGRWTSGLFAFLVGYGLAAAISIGGMETSLSVAMILIGYVLLLNREETQSAILLSLAVCFRLESAFYLLTALPLLWKNRRALASAAAIGAAYGVYCLYFFGSLLPQGMLAKRVVLQTSWSIIVDEIFDRSSGLKASLWPNSWLLPIWNWSLDHADLCACLYVAAIALIVARTLVHVRRKDASPVPLLLMTGSLALFGVYFFSKTYIFPWYSIQFSIPFAVASFNIVRRDLVIKLVLFLCLANRAPDLFYLFNGYATGTQRGYSYFRFNFRTRIYNEIGRAIAAENPNAAIYTSEIGALKWSSNLKVIDGLGLATPQALQFQPLSYPEKSSREYAPGIPSEMILIEHPDSIVTYPCLAEDLISQIQKDPQHFPYEIQSTHHMSIENSSFDQFTDIVVYRRIQAL